MFSLCLLSNLFRKFRPRFPREYHLDRGDILMAVKSPWDDMIQQFGLHKISSPQSEFQEKTEQFP